MTIQLPYVYPTGNDTDGFYSLTKYVNSVSGGLFAPMLIGVIWIIFFMATRQFGNSRAFTIASFITGILGMIFAVLDILAPKYMYALVVMIAIGALWIKLEN